MTTQLQPSRSSEGKKPVPLRLKHSALAMFLLGGISGSSLNIAISALAYYLLHLHPLAAFFLGTICNELFHHFYYHVLCVNQEIRMRSPLPLQFSFYLMVAMLALVPLHVFLQILDLGFLPSVILTILLLSLGNSVVNRLSAFSSAELAEVEYREVKEDFYDEQTDPKKVGLIRAWFHKGRFAHLNRFVTEYCPPDGTIADLGCGNCWWNFNELPVMGVDINERMLQWAKRKRRIIDYRMTADLGETGLPEKSFDIVILSEVIEHLPDIQSTLAEARRILKDQGALLVTVPYDFFLGPFFIMFNINCLYQGYVKGSEYHKLRCGHINHFTKRRLRGVLAEAGFEMIHLRTVNHLTLYAAARKS